MSWQTDLADAHRLVPLPTGTKKEPEVLIKLNDHQPEYRSKLEEQFAQVLDARLKAGEIQAVFYEPFSLRLADRTTYTPDFCVRKDDHLLFYETKGYTVGHMAASWIKVKCAAETYGFLGKWHLVQKIKGSWVIKEVGHE